MKVTKEDLTQIIKEEIQSVQQEGLSVGMIAALIPVAIMVFSAFFPGNDEVKDKFEAYLKEPQNKNLLEQIVLLRAAASNSDDAKQSLKDLISEITNSPEFKNYKA